MGDPVAGAVLAFDLGGMQVRSAGMLPCSKAGWPRARRLVSRRMGALQGKRLLEPEHVAW